MIDHIVGRPSAPWKRTQVSPSSNFHYGASLTYSFTSSTFPLSFQVFLVLFFWIYQLVFGSRTGPRLLWIRKVNRILGKENLNRCFGQGPDVGALGRWTPWQILVSAMSGLYAARNMDTILGLAGKALADPMGYVT